MNLENKNEISYINEEEAKQDRKGFVKKALAVGALAGTLFGIGGGVAGTKVVEAMSHESAPTMSDTTITVEKGDTEWAIAKQLDPSADPRDIIHELEAANRDLSAVTLTPGETIHIPVDLANKVTK